MAKQTKEPVMGLLAMAGSRMFAFACALFGLAVPLAWLWTLVGPSEEAVKVRSALILHMGVPADFQWTPEHTPATFIQSEGGTPADFDRIAASIVDRAAGEPIGVFENALAIATHLMGAPSRVDGPIRSDTLSGYRSIVEQGRGYCADFTQVFNAIAVAQRLPVREWTIAFEGFGAGHAFNEVFDLDRGKWIMVDSFHSLYFVDPATREPLSVLEVHDRLLGISGMPDPVIERIRADRFPFRSEAIAIDYYRRGMPQLAMMWGNNVFDYDRSRIVRWVGRVSRAGGQLAAIITGVYPQGRIYPVGVSQRDVDALNRTRKHVELALASSAVAALLFGLQLLALFRPTTNRPTGDVGYY